MVKEKIQAYLVADERQPVMNISQVGASLQTRHPLVIGQQYAVYMYSEDRDILVDCLVVRCSLSELEETNDGHREPKYINGLEFDLERNPKETRLMGMIQDNIYGEKRLGSSRVTPIKPLYGDVCRPCFLRIERLTTSNLRLESLELMDMEEEWSLVLRQGEQCNRIRCRVVMASKKEGHRTYDVLFEFLEPSQTTVDFIGRILDEMLHPDLSDRASDTPLHRKI